MSLLCVATFSVLHATRAGIMTGEEVTQQNEEMKMANLLLHLLQAKKMDSQDEYILLPVAAFPVILGAYAAKPML